MTGPTRKQLCTILILWILTNTAAALAQLSPGKLHQAHVDLEGLKNCKQCHAAEKQIDPNNCLDCHTLLKERIDSGEGLHAGGDFQRCQKCHIDHHGRDFTLIRWAPGELEKFDHSRTGHVLKGKHPELECRQCHKAEYIEKKENFLKAGKDLNRTYLGLNAACLACHTDTHQNQLSSSCTDCHRETAWKPASKFDHNRAAFPLSGKHNSVECDKCHKTNNESSDPLIQFTGINHSRCTYCHADVHAGRLQGECSSCHSPEGWNDVPEARFNHDNTRFTLRERHAGVSCITCHKNGYSEHITNFKKCTDCHTDVHSGQFNRRPGSGDCENCHTEEGFSPSTFSIRQHQETVFPLSGGHLAVPCLDCHKSGQDNFRLFKFDNLTCRGCHSDVHRGQVDRFLSIKSLQTDKDGCQHCHVTDSWDNITFNHTLTPFPLQGRHQLASCSDCHLDEDRDRLDLTESSSDCQTCHRDIHAGQFAEPLQTGSTLCGRCHTATDWLAEKFDHQRDSQFILSGRHLTLECNLCHKTVDNAGAMVILYKPLGKQCDTCHIDHEEK